MRQPQTVPKNIPDRAGVYLAREQDIKWWNLIVQIHGHAPYLHYSAWNMIQEKLIHGIDPSDFWFGPRIDAASDEVIPGTDERRY